MPLGLSPELTLRSGWCETFSLVGVPAVPSFVLSGDWRTESRIEEDAILVEDEVELEDNFCFCDIWDEDDDDDIHFPDCIAEEENPSPESLTIEMVVVPMFSRGSLDVSWDDVTSEVVDSPVLLSPAVLRSFINLGSSVAKHVLSYAYAAMRIDRSLFALNNPGLSRMLSAEFSREFACDLRVTMGNRELGNISEVVVCQNTAVGFVGGTLVFNGVHPGRCDTLLMTGFHAGTSRCPSSPRMERRWNARAGETGSTPRKPVRERYRPAWFPHAKTWETGCRPHQDSFYCSTWQVGNKARVQTFVNEGFEGGPGTEDMRGQAWTWAMTSPDHVGQSVLTTPQRTEDRGHPWKGDIAIVAGPLASPSISIFYYAMTRGGHGNCENWIQGALFKFSVQWFQPEINGEELSTDEDGAGAECKDGRNGIAPRKPVCQRQPISTLASHQGEPGSITGPGRRIFASGNRAGRCRWSAGFLGDLPFPPTPSFRRHSIFTSITLVGSQDFVVKSRPNLFTLPSTAASCSVRSHVIMSQVETREFGGFISRQVGIYTHVPYIIKSGRAGPGPCVPGLRVPSPRTGEDPVPGAVVAAWSLECAAHPGVVQRGSAAEHVVQHLARRVELLEPLLPQLVHPGTDLLLAPEVLRLLPLQPHAQHTDLSVTPRSAPDTQLVQMGTDRPTQLMGIQAVRRKLSTFEGRLPLGTESADQY
ncbi:hypothetical protein PR048_017616 [Dryococelus australis]|uniref:Uncharacterized protein n=1 Tax=Dryococelus australis TaxID=614101 RepID=A0ABQ9HA00_9NEOP|nr:hypothetical protein PR048_017616 [Dryococelus australis]